MFEAHVATSHLTSVSLHTHVRQAVQSSGRTVVPGRRDKLSITEWRLLLRVASGLPCNCVGNPMCGFPHSAPHAGLAGGATFDDLTAPLLEEQARRLGGAAGASTSKTDPPSVRVGVVPPRQSSVSGCDTCGRSGSEVRLLRCSRCQVTFFCSRSCQEKGWKDHKKCCIKTDSDLPKMSTAQVIVYSFEVIKLQSLAPC
jgi:hypothetical protein